MKKLKIVVKSLSFLYVAWWAGWLVLSAIVKEPVDPSGETPLFQMKPILIGLSLVGLICSAMLSVSVFGFFSDQKKLSILKGITLASCVIDNLLYQLLVCSLFGAKDGVVVTDEKFAVLALPWVIFTILCVVLLIV